MNMRTALVITACLGALAPAALAETIYVSPGQSIQQSIDLSTDGDEIIVRPGTYDGALNLRGKAIVLRGEQGPEVTILTSTAPSTSVITLDSSESWDTVIEGFTITGGTGTAAGFQSIGGGFKLFGVSPTIRNCIVRDNTAGGGGGMYLLASYPRISNCTFENNIATTTGDNGGGGAILTMSGSPQVANCSFIGNSTTGYGRGGAVRMHNGFPIYTNCLFIENEGYIGGAVDTNHGQPTFVNCTFSRNTARGYASVLHAMFSGAVITLRNSIVWDNDSPYGYPIYNTGGAQYDISYSNIADGWTGEGNIDADPMFKGVTNDDYRLSETSPCIDRGDELSLPNDLTDLDQDADIAERIPVDKDFVLRTTGSQVDMGAYEVQGIIDDPIVCPSDMNGDGLVDVTDLLELLANWGLCSGCNGDADANGVLDVFDLIYLLDAWGPCVP